MNRRRTLFSASASVAVAIAAGSFLFAGPATRPVADVLAPMATSPVPSGKSTAVATPYRPWLPPARAAREPRMLPEDGHHALRARRAVDLPPVAESSAPLPAEPALAAGPAPRWTTAGSAEIPVAVLGAKMNADRALMESDPTLDMAPPGALILTPPPRKNPAPFLLLAISDPSHQPGAIGTPGPDRMDPPAPTFDRPAGPSLLVSK